ncbi:MAG: hypothetical protein GY863_05125 [bacterium]|nr:hypothetical protein [bacterium]
MVKERTFASKMLTKADKRICPECEGVIEMVKVFDSVKSEKSDAYKFVGNMVGVCKCNEKDVYN